MEPKSIRDFLNSEDPLSNEAMSFLLDYKEEDHLIDYKQDFNLNEEKEWLEITKDIMAFANTHGGYLIFGVRDGTFDVVGLDESVAKFLADTDKILQKINRHLDPSIRLLRSKIFVKDEKQVIGLFVPASFGVTHVVSKDGIFKYQSGKEKVVLRKGTIYVRKSAGNNLADARDVDNIINRRLEYFKDSLLDKISRVVEAPIQSEVIVVSTDPYADADQTYIIDNVPEAIPVKGMSFTTPPKTPEEEIAAWVALFSKYKNTFPPNEVLWSWYKNRHSIKLSEQYRVTVAEFCMLLEVPPFFWLQGCSADFIKEMIKDALQNKASSLRVDSILKVTAFFGKRFYNSVFKDLGESKLYRRKYPDKGPRSSYNTQVIEAMRNRNKYSEKQLRTVLESELTEIADKLYNQKLRGMERDKLLWQAYNNDCYLYAQDDKYK